MTALADRIQQAWQSQSPWLRLLRPLSYVYRAGFLLQKAMKQRHAYQAPLPVMVVGNITVGGSGKTPLIIALVEYLQAQQVKLAVISRGYGGAGPFPAWVDQQSLATQVGDEPLLIVQSTAVPMAVGPNRQAAIELLLARQPDLQLIISDDGLQHFALSRDIEWVVLDRMRGLGNQKLLPEGYLREPISRLDSVTVIEHHPEPNSALNMHLQAEQPYCLADPSLDFDPSAHYQAVVGIGYPQRFFNSLTALGIDFSPRIFADHHQYRSTDFNDYADQPLLTTGKDAVKLQQLFAAQPERLAKIWVLPVRAKLSAACYHTLQQQLLPFGIKLSP